MPQTEAANPLDVLRDAVQAERGRQGSVKAAIVAVAQMFGLPQRRVEAVWWREGVRLDWEEAARIRAVSKIRWEREMAEAEARAALLRVRLAALGDDGAPP